MLLLKNLGICNSVKFVLNARAFDVALQTRNLRVASRALVAHESLH